MTDPTPNPPTVEVEELIEEALHKAELNGCTGAHMPLNRAIWDSEHYLVALATALRTEIAARERVERDLVAAICKEPPCMYGSNERVYVLSLIEARQTCQKPSVAAASRFLGRCAACLDNAYIDSDCGWLGKHDCLIASARQSGKEQGNG